MKESELKSAVEEYLQYQQNAGKLEYKRLNSGKAFLPIGDGKYRAIQLCEEGTADYEVTIRYVTPHIKCTLWAGDLHFYVPGSIRTRWDEISCNPCRTIYFELKGEKGKQSQAQKDWQARQEAVGAEYYIIRSVDEAIGILE
jgi:hypothetical protein